MRTSAMGVSAIGAAAAAMLAGGSSALAGDNTWAETGDAGQTIGTAQQTLGLGSLQVLTGVLDGRNDVDIFCIHITDEALFRAQVTSFAGQDSILWLFNPDGTLQVANDDFGGGALSTITSQGVFSNGIYYLGVSRFANIPLNAANASLLTNTFWPGPDFQQIRGNANILDHWNNGTSPGNVGGAYSITLRGAEFCPTPGAAALLGLGGLVAGRRRRA